MTPPDPRRKVPVALAAEIEQVSTSTVRRYWEAHPEDVEDRGGLLYVPVPAPIDAFPRARAQRLRREEADATTTDVDTNAYWARLVQVLESELQHNEPLREQLLNELRRLARRLGDL